MPPRATRARAEGARRQRPTASSPAAGGANGTLAIGLLAEAPRIAAALPPHELLFLRSVRLCPKTSRHWISTLKDDVVQALVGAVLAVIGGPPPPPSSDGVAGGGPTADDYAAADMAARAWLALVSDVAAVEHVSAAAAKAAPGQADNEIINGDIATTRIFCLARQAVDAARLAAALGSRAPCLARVIEAALRTAEEAGTRIMNRAKALHSFCGPRDRRQLRPYRRSADALFVLLRSLAAVPRPPGLANYLSPLPAEGARMLLEGEAMWEQHGVAPPPERAQTGAADYLAKRSVVLAAVTSAVQLASTLSYHTAGTRRRRRRGALGGGDDDEDEDEEDDEDEDDEEGSTSTLDASAATVEILHAVVLAATSCLLPCVDAPPGDDDRTGLSASLRAAEFGYCAGQICPPPTLALAALLAQALRYRHAVDHVAPQGLNAALRGKIRDTVTQLNCAPALGALFAELSRAERLLLDPVRREVGSTCPRPVSALEKRAILAAGWAEKAGLQYLWTLVGSESIWLPGTVPTLRGDKDEMFGSRSMLMGIVAVGARHAARSYYQAPPPPPELLCVSMGASSLAIMPALTVEGISAALSSAADRILKEHGFYECLDDPARLELSLSKARVAALRTAALSTEDLAASVWRDFDGILREEEEGAAASCLGRELGDPATATAAAAAAAAVAAALGRSRPTLPTSPMVANNNVAVETPALTCFRFGQIEFAHEFATLATAIASASAASVGLRQRVNEARARTESAVAIMRRFLLATPASRYDLVPLIYAHQLGNVSCLDPSLQACLAKRALHEVAPAVHLMMREHASRSGNGGNGAEASGSEEEASEVSRRCWWLQRLLKSPAQATFRAQMIEAACDGITAVGSPEEVLALARYGVGGGKGEERGGEVRRRRRCASLMCPVRGSGRPDKFYKCAGCGCVYYCDRTCQTAGFEGTHALLCPILRRAREQREAEEAAEEAEGVDEEASARELSGTA